MFQHRKIAYILGKQHTLLEVRLLNVVDTRTRQYRGSPRSDASCASGRAETHERADISQPGSARRFKGWNNVPAVSRPVGCSAFIHVQADDARGLHSVAAHHAAFLDSASAAAVLYRRERSRYAFVRPADDRGQQTRTVT